MQQPTTPARGGADFAFQLFDQSNIGGEIAQLEQRSIEDIARTWHPSRASTTADLGLSRESCSH
jgi:hypothetical protein